VLTVSMTSKANASNAQPTLNGTVNIVTVLTAILKIGVSADPSLYYSTEVANVRPARFKLWGCAQPNEIYDYGYFIPFLIFYL